MLGSLRTSNKRLVLDPRRKKRLLTWIKALQFAKFIFTQYNTDDVSSFNFNQTQTKNQEPL